MSSLFATLLPLARDPFPPTHKAGSEFEGFFLRLESHSARHPHRPTEHQPCSPAKHATPAKTPRSTPSRIPRLSSSTFRTSKPAASLRQRRERASSSSGADEAASDSSQQDPPSPSPTPRRPQRYGARANVVDSPATATGKATAMLTQIDAVFDSPESYLPIRSDAAMGSIAALISAPSAEGADGSAHGDSPPGDLILVVCELQSAPIDQRICVYLRWIVHGEEAAQHQSLRPSSHSAATGKQKEAGESFEVVHYLPSWQLKLGARADAFSVQPFRLDLLSVSDSHMGSMGSVEVKADGNVVVDMTLPNAMRGERGGTRVRLRSTKLSPWHPRGYSTWPMGMRGPEGWIQHLGAVLPLHWYVHTTNAPALFSLEHVQAPQERDSEGAVQLDHAVAAGRGLLHAEKNWGQGFPTGWIWAHATSPPHVSGATSEPVTRLSLAGGSILGLTALLVGIHIQPRSGSKAQERDWNFTPPFTLGPQCSFPLTTTKRMQLGIGFRMHRDFGGKTLALDVWDLRRWAQIHIAGPEHSFATQIPGPTKGGWTPAYCHHSYRCKATITLYERSVRSVVHVALRPSAWIRAWKHGCLAPGWNRVERVELDDRVALEFGGDYAV